jgi:cytochrome b561
MTIVLHWVMAAMVATLWGGAMLLGLTPPGAARADARSLHIVLGLVLGVFGAARFAWRLSWGRPLPPADVGWQGVTARITHQGLYGLLAAMVLIGVLLVWTTGDSLFGTFPVRAADADALDLARRMRSLHAAVGWAIVGLVAIHGLAVLFHQIVLHDAVLGRMVFARSARTRSRPPDA